MSFKKKKGQSQTGGQSWIRKLVVRYNGCPQMTMGWQCLHQDSQRYLTRQLLATIQTYQCWNAQFHLPMFIDFCKDSQVVHLEKQISSLLIFIAARELKAFRELLPNRKALHYLKDNRSTDTVAVMVNCFVHWNKITIRTSVESLSLHLTFCQIRFLIKPPWCDEKINLISAACFNTLCMIGLVDSGLL